MGLIFHAGNPIEGAGHTFTNAIRMAYDPLSPTTRKTRTSMLIFSTIQICISVFDVTLKNVTGVGFEIEVDERLLPFIISVVLIYLTISFLLYSYDDLFYLESPRRIDLEITSNREKANQMWNYILKSIEKIGKKGELDAWINEEMLDDFGRDPPLLVKLGIAERYLDRLEQENNQQVTDDKSNSEAYYEIRGGFFDIFNIRSSIISLQNYLRYENIDITKLSKFRIYIFDFTLPTLISGIAIFFALYDFISYLRG